MFMHQDCVTEIVAHFIGYFHIHAEDIRYRSDYAPFAGERSGKPAQEPLELQRFNFHETLDIPAYLAAVVYIPPIPIIETIQLIHSVSFQGIPLHLPAAAAAHPDFDLPAPPASAAAARFTVAEEPGSTVLIASQIKYLMDDDILVVGDHEFETGFRTEAHAEVAAMTDTALSASDHFSTLASLRSVPDMVGLVDDMAAEAKTLSLDDFEGFDSVHLETGSRIEGFYSNGVAVAEQVLLSEAFPAVAATETPPQDVTESALTIDASKTPTTMHVSSGGNVSWNEAVLVNAGATAAVIAIGGDYHRIDAIYQTNVVRDIDSVDENWPAQNLTIGGNIVQNSAAFKNTEFASDAAASKPGTFPQSWNVTTVSGDMIFLDWVQQYNFTSDNDTQILTAMGTNTYISSGLNLGLNALSFINLGKLYDLIIVGGSVYDGNFISQTNVLLDSDNLTVEGESSAFKGNASTGENVVWNEATIENIGAANWSADLPSHYREALDNLAQGKKDMPTGFSKDGDLEGFGNLKVLYVAGNIYDIHTIDQVNIVGDADDLALYESNLLKAQESVWQVTTGQNTLVNKAAILDYDSVGKTAYVGGQIYSDAILVQAELFEGIADRLTVRGNELANEVLAFLHDQTDLSTRLADHPAVAVMSDHGASFDVTQSVFA